MRLLQEYLTAQLDWELSLKVIIFFPLMAMVADQAGDVDLNDGNPIEDEHKVLAGESCGAEQ